MGSSRRIIFNGNDCAVLSALIAAGGEMQGALQVGLLFANSHPPSRSHRQITLAGGLAMYRLVQMGLIEEFRVGESVVFRINDAGRDAVISKKLGGISVIAKSRRLLPLARPKAIADS